MDTAQPTQPLPDIDTLLESTRENLASNEYLQGQYTYKERDVELKMNPFGRIGTGSEYLYEVYPFPEADLTYRRLLAKDGVAVDPKDLADQDRKQREKIAAYRQRVTAEGEIERARRVRGERERRRKEQETVDDVLDVFEYRVVGRETSDGEPAILVAFTPREHATPRTNAGRLVQHFAGKAWVSERDYQVMRVESEAISTVSFGWGILARIHKGTKGLAIRRRLDDGAWVPVETRLTGTGRALLFRSFEIDLRTQYFDYRKIDPSEPFPFDEVLPFTITVTHRPSTGSLRQAQGVPSLPRDEQRRGAGCHGGRMPP